MGGQVLTDRHSFSLGVQVAHGHVLVLRPRRHWSLVLGADEGLGRCASMCQQLDLRRRSAATPCAYVQDGRVAVVAEGGRRASRRSTAWQRRALLFFLESAYAGGRGIRVLEDDARKKTSGARRERYMTGSSHERGRRRRRMAKCGKAEGGVDYRIRAVRVANNRVTRKRAKQTAAGKLGRERDGVEKCR